MLSAGPLASCGRFWRPQPPRRILNGSPWPGLRCAEDEDDAPEEPLALEDGAADAEAEEAEEEIQEQAKV